MTPQRAHAAVALTFCHATYLINLATPDDELYAKQRRLSHQQPAVARGMGASGLVLHIGSHKGAGTEGVRRPGRRRDCIRALDEADDPADATPPACPILLENAAGAGGTVGRTLRGARDR